MSAAALQEKWSGLMPKRPTQAEEFLREHPEYDGRNVVVAVLDTGCDPRAPGLTLTPDGQPKIIDCVDTTGSGDVDTSHVVHLALVEGESASLVGLSGRALRLGANWENPSGHWHLGLKKAYEMFPKPVADRVKQMRKERWAAKLEERKTALRGALQAAAADQEHKTDLQAQLKVLQAWADSHEDPGPIFDCLVWHDGKSWLAVVDVTETGDLTELQPMQDYALGFQVGDFGVESNQTFTVSIFEEGHTLCIVTQAGSHGTHVAGIVGAYFPDQPELNGIAPGCQMISIKIGDSRLGSMETGPGLVRAMRYIADFCSRRPGGRRVDLINMSYGEPAAFCQSGTFVEAAEHVVHQHGVIYVTSAGNDGPALSTIGAPAAISSAMIAVGAYVEPEMMRDEYAMAEAGFRERPYSWSSKGPTADGHTGVSVCAPGGAVASVPTWALKKTQLMNGTSMASPSACGSLALLISALKANPGMRYSPQSVRRAVENTARVCPEISVFNQGCGLVQVAAAWDWLQKVSEAATLYATVPIEVSVGGSKNRGLYVRNPARLREFADGGGEITATAHLSPRFQRLESRDPRLSPKDSQRLAELNEERLGYELRLTLRATADWVLHPKQVSLLSDGKSFKFTARTVDLPPGAHYAEIQGVADDHPELGALFRVPVTVIVPHRRREELPEAERLAAGPVEEVGADYVFAAQVYEPRSGRQRRWFVEPPLGATWVDVLYRHRGLVDCGEVPQGVQDRVQLMGHLLQLKPHQPYRRHNSCKFFSLAPGETYIQSLAVDGPQLLEVCLAQYWSAAAGAQIDVQVRFHGLWLEAAAQQLMLGSAPYRQLVVNSSLRDELMSPSASFKTLRKSLAPKYASLLPLPDLRRNGFLDDQTVYALDLQYEFKAAASGKLKPRVPLANGVLYEAVFSSQMWMLFDRNRKLVGSGDCFPSKASVKEGQEYVLRLRLSHHQHGLLEQLQQMPVELDYALEKSVELAIFPSYTSMLESMAGKGKPVGKKLALRRGHSMSLFLQAPTEKALKAVGKAAEAGDLLLGELSLEAGVQPTLQGSGKRPSGFPVAWVVPASSKPAEMPNKVKPSAPPKLEVLRLLPEEEEHKEDPAMLEEPPEVDLRDLQLDRLGKLIPDFVAGLLERKPPGAASNKPPGAQLRALAEAWLPALLAAWPAHGPLLALQLQYRVAMAFAEQPLNLNAPGKVAAELLQQVEVAAEALQAVVDAPALAAHFGLLRDPDDLKAEQKDKEKKREKTWLLQALTARLLVIGQRLLQTGEEEQAAADADAATQLRKHWTAVWKQLRRWADPKSQLPLELLVVHWSKVEGAASVGRRLEALDAAIKDAEAKAAGLVAWKCSVGSLWKLRQEIILGELAWPEWSQYWQENKIANYPASYTPF